MAVHTPALRRHRAHPRAALALALVGLVLLAVIVTLVRQHGATSGLTLKPCTIADRPARCGTLAVPENPADPGGKKISLNVAVVPAIGNHAKADPLFWFAGWGGAGVSDDAANVLPALRGVNFDRDLVFIDQRGTGSSKLVCQILPQGDPTHFDAAAVTAAARRCAQRIGPNLRYYTSAVAVDDFDRVRQALGYDKINIYGGSYGVTTGQIYLLRHGSHVRTATFDSGSLLDVAIFERIAPNAQRALDLLFARCAADTACHTAYPHLRRDFARVQARVAEAPIALPGTTTTLNPATLADVVEEQLAYSPDKALLPRLVHLIATGQISAAMKLQTPGASGSPDELAYMRLIECSEPWAIRRPATVERLAAGSFYAPAARLSVRVEQASCKGIPKGYAPAAIGQRVRSRVPVLLLTGNEDPADPPANIAHARRELPNSRTVIFPRSGHGQLGLLCAQNLITDFVNAGTAAGLNTACAKTAVQQSFDY